MKKIMLDLYSGLGGASEAFMLNPGWEVHRLENNLLLKEVPTTKIQDITTWDFYKEIPVGYYDLIWASPPCDDFSLGFNAPGPTAQRKKERFTPDMQHLTRSLEIIRFLKPKWWVIENVAGASKIFSDFLEVEKPTQIIRPYFLWGKFPHIEMPYGWQMALAKTARWGIDDPLRKNKRGKVDFEVSSALMRAVDSQTTLEDWV